MWTLGRAASHAHVVVVGDGDVDVDDGPPFVRCKDVPLLVRRTVRYLSVVLALKNARGHKNGTFNRSGGECGTSGSGGKAAQVTTDGVRLRSNARVWKTAEGPLK